MVYIGTLSKFLIKKSNSIEICGWKQGRDFELYDNGRIRGTYGYLNNKLHGRYVVWYDNGQLWAMQNYMNGHSHSGEFLLWYRNGQLWGEIQ